jgi:hypothetical protein
MHNRKTDASSGIVKLGPSWSTPDQDRRDVDERGVMEAGD